MPRKFYETKGFKALNAKWKKKLALSGFVDLENDRQELTEHHFRTNRYITKEQSEKFFDTLSSYLANNTMPKRDRQVLELYVEGVKVAGDGGICDQLNMSHVTVYRIITKHYKQA
jgi:predicted transcriptional regulator YheO